MTPDTPEPEAPRPGAPRPDGATPVPPRVLVSVGDLEDPAEWDVILVENQDIDDDTARRIAAERAGRPLPPPSPGRRLGPPKPPRRTVTLPSLDERDVIQAFETDREAEDADDISVDAFAPPEDAAQARRRPISTELPPEHDAFEGIPEPGDPEPEPTEDEAAFPGAVEFVDEPEVVEAAEPETGEPAEPWVPAHREGPALVDDPDDDFYAIAGDEVADDDAADSIDASDDVTADEAEPADADSDEASGLDSDTETGTKTETTEASDDADDAPGDDAEDADDTIEGDAEDTSEAADDPTDNDAAGATDDAADEPAAEIELDEWDLSAGALDEDRELLDDPDDSFYGLGLPRVSAFRSVPPPVIAGGKPLVSLPSPSARLNSELWGTKDQAPAPADEVFEDELEVDSSFPLGPDDLAPDGEVEPPRLDDLDYANVFGPVTGSLSVPDLTGPPQRGPRRPAYEDDLYVFEEDDEDGRWPVPPPRATGRRRELVALGLAAGVIVALGVGSQVFSPSEPQQGATVDATTSTTRVRARTTDVTPPPPDLTLPTLVDDDPSTDPGGSTNTTARRSTTTTAKKGAVTTVAPTTTAAPTTTEPPVTTTTEPPVTTTTEPPSTTTTI